MRVLILTTSWIEVIQLEGIRLGTGNSPPRVQVIKFQCKKLAVFETPIPGFRKLTVQRYVGGLASPLPGFKL
jgi:hypothetical protein